MQGASSDDAPDPENEAMFQSFCEQWGLNEDAFNKLRKLCPAAQTAVMNQFAPKGEPKEGSCWSGKFIVFATQIDRHCIMEAGYAVGTKRGFDQAWDARTGMVPTKVPKGYQKGGASSADTPNPEHEAMFQSFCEQWGLNEDAFNKLQKLCPAAQSAVMNQFAPKGEPKEGSCWSGKFIVFATQIDRGMRNDPCTAFIERWNLNQDAQNKLWELSAPELNTVLSEFAPPPAPDVNGKFIMFAKSIQNSSKGAMFGKGAYKGGMIKGDPYQMAYGAPKGLPYGANKGGMMKGNPYQMAWGADPYGGWPGGASKGGPIGGGMLGAGSMITGGNKGGMWGGARKGGSVPAGVGMIARGWEGAPAKGGKGPGMGVHQVFAYG